MNKRMAILFLFITVMLDALGIGIIMPVMPGLIADMNVHDLGDAAQWGAWMSTTFAAMQFLFGPLLGNLSDRFGRRPVLLLSLFAMSVDYLIMVLAPNLWILLVARMFGGIFAATHSTAYACIADLSDDDDKARLFGLMSAAFGAGFLLGPIIGGLLGDLGPRVPFMAAAGFAFLNVLFGLVVLRETVTDDIRRPFEWKRANPVAGLKYVGRFPGMLRLLIVWLLWNFSFYVYPAVWSFYALERYGWDTVMIGLSLSVFGLCSVIVNGVGIQKAIRWFGEHRTSQIGLTISALAFLAYAFAEQGWMIFIISPIAALGFVAGPAIQGIMSRTVPDNQQGELQGLQTSVTSIAIIISPLVMTRMFGWFIDDASPVYLPGAPFILSTILIFAGLFIFSGRDRLYTDPRG